MSDTGNTATTYTDATVASSGASYAYRVKAIRDGERSGASNEVRVQLKPARPTGLSAETVAYNSVTLAWDEPNDDDGVTGYVVMRLDFVRSDLVTLAANTGTADTGYTDETVEPDTLYFYYLMAINPGGESELSDHAVAHTPEAPDPALFAPSNLTVQLADGRVSLGWDPPAEDAGSVTGYEILRARGWDDPIILVADTASAATAHTDETADAPGESYAYRVKAVPKRGTEPGLRPSGDSTAGTAAFGPRRIDRQLRRQRGIPELASPSGGRRYGHGLRGAPRPGRG